MFERRQLLSGIEGHVQRADARARAAQQGVVEDDDDVGDDKGVEVGEGGSDIGSVFVCCPAAMDQVRVAPFILSFPSLRTIQLCSLVDSGSWNGGCWLFE